MFETIILIAGWAFVMVGLWRLPVHQIEKETETPSFSITGKALITNTLSEKDAMFPDYPKPGVAASGNTAIDTAVDVGVARKQTGQTTSLDFAPSTVPKAAPACGSRNQIQGYKSNEINE